MQKNNQAQLLMCMYRCIATLKMYTIDTSVLRITDKALTLLHSNFISQAKAVMADQLVLLLVEQ